MDLPENLIKQIKEKKLIPFVGAGASLAINDEERNPIFPTWGRLLDNAAKKIKSNGDEGQANIVNEYIKKNKLLKAAEEAKEGLEGLWSQFLKTEFDPNLEKVNKEEFKLAQTILKFDNPLVITTNYDKILELIGRNISTWGISQEAEFADFKQGSLKKRNKKAIWHMHGHIDKSEEIILTPESYKSLYSNETIKNSIF